MDHFTNVISETMDIWARELGFSPTSISISSRYYDQIKSLLKDKNISSEDISDEIIFHHARGYVIIKEDK